MQFCSLVFGGVFPPCGFCCCVAFAYCLTQLDCVHNCSQVTEGHSLCTSSSFTFLQSRILILSTDLLSTKLTRSLVRMR